MSTNQLLLAEIQRFLKRTGMAETTFGQKATNNWRLVERLQAGGSVTLTAADRIRAFIAANSPSEEKSRRRVA